MVTVVTVVVTVVRVVRVVIVATVVTGGDSGDSESMRKDNYSQIFLGIHSFPKNDNNTCKYYQLPSAFEMQPIEKDPTQGR
jgi:hypothetical protein